MILAFTGDIAFSKYFKEAYSNENLFSKDVVDFLNSADYTIANIEAPITNGTATAKKTLVHTSSLKSVDALKKINANVWNLSNNHAMDCGQKGLEDTMELARNNQILTLGAGLNLEKASEPLVLRKGNVRVGVLAVSYRGAVIAKEDSAGCLFWGDYKIIKKRIKQIKSKCDYCIVVAHAGEEFTSLPLPIARNKYKKYLKFGADIVVGHHPHVPQNYEQIGDKIIFYSLGNFVFDTDYQRIQKNTDKGVLIKINFEKSGYKWKSMSIKINRNENTIEETEPLFIFQNITAKNYNKLQPYVLEEDEYNLRKKWLFNKKIDVNISKKEFKKKKLKRFEPFERFCFMRVKLIKKCNIKNSDMNEIIRYILEK